MKVSIEAQTAAKWWADKLRGIPKFDNGDDSPIGGMVSAMAMLAAAKSPPVADDKIGQFEQALAEDVQRRLDAVGSAYLGCDYGPDYELAQVADRFGVAGMGRFPWKTNMWIKPGEVSVSEGYGAESVNLSLVEGKAA